LKRLNNPAFQREHIIKDKVILRHGPHRNTIPPSGDRSATDNASIQEMPEKDSPDTLHKASETLSDGPNDQVKEVAHVSSHVVDGPSDVFHSPMAIPEVLDEHIVPSKEDILKYLKEEDESKTVADVQDHPEEIVLPHTPQSTDGQVTDQDLSESDWSAGESMRSERYELLHWPEHFKQLERITDDETKQSERWNTLYADLETFLQRDSEAYQWWLRRWAPWREFENFESPHLIAAGCGLLELLKRQLSSNKYDLNERNDDNDTALLLACGKEGHCCVRFLIELGADVNATNNAGATPLLHLIRHRGSMDDFDALLKAGAKADIADNNGVTPLHLAAENSNLEMCKALLKVKGVNANAKDKIYGETALHVSFKRSDPSAELLELLIANGADVNEQDNDSQGALYEACSVGDANSAAVLLRLGADINDDEDVFGHTALHAAIAVKSLPTVKVLIDAGADLTLRDKSGQSALHQSIVVGQFQIFECIIEALIANDLLQQQILQHETLDAFTPLHCACHHGDFDMTNRLLEIGNASQMVSEKDRRGDLALHLAAENSFTAIVLLLLNAGSDPKEKNISALTPIDLAVLTWTHGPMDEPPTENMVLTVLALIGKADVAQQHELVLMDIEAEAMTPICFEYKHLRDMPDEHGWTPLALARQLRRPRKVKMLLDGAEGDYEPKIVGERPTKLYRLSRPSYQGRDVDFTGSEDELEVRTFKEDLSFDPEYGKSIDNIGVYVSKQL
jgi:ankyrin repeat protein